MYKKLLATLVGALILAVPLSAAQDVVNDPLRTVGGAYVRPTINAPPVELDMNGNPVPAAANPSEGAQRLVSEGTYDCATGLPATGVGSGKYSLDVIPLLLSASQGVLIDDNVVVRTLAPVTGETAPPSDSIAYGAGVRLGYGASHPIAIYPGALTFMAYLFCGGQITGVLPEPLAGQTKGLFGWQDEISWGSAGAYPELIFSYTKGYSGQGGAVGPGDIGTPGWYTSSKVVDARHVPQAMTWRFAVNPSLVAEFPGYTGSLYDAAERKCFFATSDSSSLFDNCHDTLYDYNNPSPAEATPAAPAPVLEDVDVFGPADAFLGLNVVEPLYMEAQAAPWGALDTVDSLIPSLPPLPVNPFDPVGQALSRALTAAVPPREAEPNVPGEDINLVPLMNGWVYYFDVIKWQSVGAPGVAVLGLNVDPLYGAGVQGQRNIYPGFTWVTATLQLWKDENGDGIRNTGDRFFNIPDALTYFNNNTVVANWGDVGSTQSGGSHLIASEITQVRSLCGPATAEAVPYLAGEEVPLSPQNIAACNPRGDAEAGWGTVRFDTADGSYKAWNYIFGAGGTTTGVWQTSMMARVVWPTLAELDLSGIILPEGIEKAAVAGTSVFLHDVDYYGPTVV